MIISSHLRRSKPKRKD